MAGRMRSQRLWRGCRCPKCGVRLVAHSEFKRGRAPPFQFLGKTGKQVLHEA